MFFNLGVAPKEPISVIITAVSARFYLILRAHNEQETFNLWDLFLNACSAILLFGEKETQIDLQ